MFLLLSHRRRIPERVRPFNLFRPPFGHRLPEFDVFKSVHVYKDDPIKLPQPATSAAKSNCARAVPLLPAGGSDPVHAA